MGTGLLLRSDTGRGFCYQKRLSALILSALRFIPLRKCFPKPPAKVNLQHSRGSLSIVWFLGIWLRSTGTPPLEGEKSHNKPSLHMPFLPLVNSVFLTFPLENTERTVHGGARPDILGTSNLPR